MRRFRGVETGLCVWLFVISSLDEDFVCRYVLYVYFRTEWGCVARSGVKFGVDLCLYRSDVSGRHSHSIAMVFVKGLPSQGKNSTSWGKIRAARRVATTARTGLVLCEVEGELGAAGVSAVEARKELSVQIVELCRARLNR